MKHSRFTDEQIIGILKEQESCMRTVDVCRKHGNPIDFLLTAKRDLDAAKRFFRKMLKNEPLLSPRKIGTDGANTLPQRSRRPSMTGSCIQPGTLCHQAPPARH